MAKWKDEAQAKPLLVLPFVPRLFAVRPRLTAAILTGLATGIAAAVLAPQLKLATDLILGWDALAATFIASMLLLMIRRGPAEIRTRAAHDDEGRAAILLLMVLAIAVSLGATGWQLTVAKEVHGLWKALHVSLACATVAASWTVMQLIFAVHYAHEYYDPDPAAAGKDRGGLVFPGGEAPDYWDFLHFSMVIGVACQTADIAFTSKQLRRLGTVHSLLAFAYNTAIVALTINLVAGLF